METAGFGPLELRLIDDKLYLFLTRPNGITRRVQLHLWAADAARVLGLIEEYRADCEPA